jgi:hypothetical protein
MIPIKSKRAVISSLENFPEEEEVQNDMNGTAKVVTRCVERSIFAWNGILSHFPGQEEEAITNIATLKQLKLNIEHFFPDAEKFIRLGFDEVRK